MLWALLGFLAISAQASSIPVPAPAPGLYLNSEGSPLIPLLQSVQQTLDIEIYTMGDLEVRALLRDALSRGVKIRIVQEPNPDQGTCDLFAASSGSASSDSKSSADCEDQKKLVSEVRAAGGSYVPFDKSTLCPNGGGSNGQGCYEHGKIAIADGTTALMSTGNFDDTNLCIVSTGSSGGSSGYPAERPSECDRDFSIITDDSAIVSTLQSLFEADLAGQSYDVRTLIPASLQQTLTVSPYSLQPLVDFVKSATTSLDIETQYLEDPQLNQAIEAAAKKGVKVTVTVASACAFGPPKSYEVKETTTTYTAFDQAGISTAMFDSSNLINGFKGYMHDKAIVVDGNRAWVGSENGSNGSLNENREYGLFFDTPEEVQKLLDVIQADHASPDSETWQESLKCQKDDKSVGDSSGGAGDGGSGGGNSQPTRPPKKSTHHKKATHSSHSTHSSTHRKKKSASTES